MSHPELKGRRAIILVRCSTTEQPQSIQDQLDACHQFAQRNEMVVTDCALHEGVSASIESNLDTIFGSLIDRKIRHGSFDSILVFDVSRFSRSGAKHSAKLRWELEQVGLEIISVIGYCPPSPYSDVVDTIGAAQAREHARSIAAASARGSQSSLERGDRAHCTKPPYGVNRLILSEDGQELFVLQNEPDGTQLRLDPKSGEVLERYAHRVGGISGHYKKTRGQRIVLVPGAEDRAETVKYIFARYEKDGLGYYRIAAELNDRAIPSPTGGVWYLKTVRGVLHNPTYCGAGLANIRTKAVYFERSNGAPTDATKRGRKTASGLPATIFRDPDDWIWIEYPGLSDFLPESIRDKALARQKRFLADRASGKHQRSKKDKHFKSDFILKNVLKTSDGYSMSGRRSGRNSMYRQYALTRSESAPKTGAPIPRIRAEAVEEPIVAELRRILMLMPLLRASVLERSHEWAEGRHQSTDRSKLEKRLAKLNRQIGIALNLDAEDDEIARQLADLLHEKSTIKAQLDADGELPHLSAPEIEEVVDLVLENFQILGQVMGEFDPGALRQLIDIFVEEAVVDLETREVTVVFRIPSWAMLNDRLMGLDRPSDSKSLAEAHRFLSFEISFEVPTRRRPAA